MASDIMDTIRQAEISAQELIEKTERSAELAWNIAKSKSDAVLKNAQQDADAMVALAIDKANSKAEEIIITAKNSALLEADKLRNKCNKRQQEVNEMILSLIV